jgi:serine/threonine-protein kinase
VGRDGKRVGERRPFLDDRFSRGEAEFSPDGKWVAFRSNQNGVNDVFVTSFPAGEVQPVSTGGGEQPRWNSNGRELFYRNGDKMMVVEVITRGGTIEVGPARVLFEKAAVGYDVALNGTRFLMLKPSVTGAPRRADLHVTLNWFDELRRRAPLPE